MSSRVLVIVLSMILSTPTFAQTLKGKIADELTKEYLERAEVYIPEIHKKAITDNFGSFEFKDLPKGKFKVQVALDGYKTYITFIEILQGTNLLNANLSINYINDEDIAVAAPYFKSKNENTINIIQVHPGKYGTPNKRSLTEALSHTEGVSAITYGLSGQRPMLRMQDMRKISVYNNGVQMQMLPWERYGNTILPYMGIDKIEIIKGPGSLQYGSSALGGVIYVVDEKPAETNHLEGDANVLASANGGGLQVNAGAKYASEKFFYGIRIGRNDYADLNYSLINQTTLDNSRFNENQAKINVGYNDHNLSSRLKLSINDGKYGIISNRGSNSFTDRTPSSGSNRTGRFINVSHQNTVYVKKSRIHLNYGIHNYDIQTIGALPSAYVNNGSYYDINWALSINENSNMIVGTQYKGNNYAQAEGSIAYIPNGDEYENSYFFFINHADKSNKTNIQFGFRYNSNTIKTDATTNDFTSINEYAKVAAVDTSFEGISAAIGGTLNLSDNVAIRINTSMGYRAPTIAELASNGGMPGSFGNGSIIEIGNTSLKHEQSTQFDIGVDVNRENFKFSLSAFSYDILNYIQQTPIVDSLENPIEDPSGNMYYTYEQVNANIYGTEFGIKYSPYRYRWLVLNSNISYLIGYEDRPSGLASSREYLRNIPAATWKNEVQVFLSKDIWKFEQPFFTLEVDRYFGRSIEDEPYLNYAALNLVNLHGGFKLPWGRQHVEFTGSLNNILGVNSPFPVSLESHRGLVNPGRNVMVGLKIPFATDLKPKKTITMPNSRGSVDK
jgi:iron complex outermembrane receptor protein